MAAPEGDSTYSYSRTTFGSSREPSTLASLRNISANSGSSSRSASRYLIATSTPDVSCLASITRPNPPEPSVFSPVYPGTSHSGMQLPPPFRGVTRHQHLTTTAVEAAPLLGPRTCSVTVCDTLPWPWPSTATVTKTACCPATARTG